MFKKNCTFAYLVFSLFALIFLISSFANAEVSPERERELRSELAEIEQQIKEQQSILSTKQQEGSSIERDVAILNAKIREAQLKIKKHSLEIERLGKDIVVKTSVIEKLDKKIDEGKMSLAQIIRKTNQLDDYSLPEVILSGDTVSTFFEDIDEFDSVKDAMSSTFTELRDNKKVNEQEKENLNEKRNQEIDTKINVEDEKKKIEKAEAEKKRLLAINKAEQNTYKKVIADKSKRVAEIKAALFSLRDAVSIPFGTALEYAKKASAKTGVRPAFVLAILTQESNLGANVGSCYLTDLTTGDGKGKNTGTLFERVMKAPRDTEPFEDITSALGRDWSTTAVSCPIGSTKYYSGRGFGGAMGPAQFIPSTWKLIENRISKYSDTSNPDPWNPEHAFMASSIYLGDLGAGAGTYTSEIKAACKYYGSGGSSCSYGNQVMAKVKKIQADIDILENN